MLRVKIEEVMEKVQEDKFVRNGRVIFISCLMRITCMSIILNVMVQLMLGVINIIKKGK